MNLKKMRLEAWIFLLTLSYRGNSIVRRKQYKKWDDNAVYLTHDYWGVWWKFCEPLESVNSSVIFPEETIVERGRANLVWWLYPELNSDIVPLRWVSEAHNVSTVMWLWPEMIGPILGTISQQWSSVSPSWGGIQLAHQKQVRDVTQAIQSHGTSTSVADRATRRAPLLQ